MPVDAGIQIQYNNTLLDNLDPAHVWAEGWNQNYEGDIKGKGDVLKVHTLARPTVNDYTVGGSLTYQRLRPSAQEIHIDQDEYWAVEDDALESSLRSMDLMNDHAKNGAWAFADGADKFLAFRYADRAGVTHTATTVGLGFGETKPYDLIEQMVEDLKVQSVPMMDLHIFIPIWMMTMAHLDPRISGFGTADSRRTIRGERVTEMTGVTIHESVNALDSAGTAVDSDGPVNTAIMAWKGAATWGRHIPENGMVEFIDHEQRENFDDAMRGRYVYGGEVIYPMAVVKCVVTKGSYNP